MNYIDLTQQNGSGVSDYDQLTNQPQINGVTLTGNKTTTDLGIQDARILPDNYTINIKADGTGDFATLTEALESLKGKVSAGSVVINLDAGTHTFSSTAGDYEWDGGLSNIAYILIQGTGKTTTTINITGSTLNFTRTPKLKIKNLTFLDTAHTKNDFYAILYINRYSNVMLQNVKVTGGCIYNYACANLIIESGTVDIANTGSGIMTFAGSCTDIAGTITFTNVQYCLCVDRGGKYTLDFTDFKYSNITEYFGLWRTGGHFSSDGAIWIGKADGIISGYMTATAL